MREVVYDSTESAVVPNMVTQDIPLKDVPSGRPNTLIDPDVSQVLGILDEKYWLADPENNRVVPMTEEQKAAVDAAEAALNEIAMRNFHD